MLVDRRRLRQGLGDARRASLSESGSLPWNSSGAGSFPVRTRCTRLDLLRATHVGFDRAPHSDVPDRRSDPAARIDEPGQLRPAVPLPGCAHRPRYGQLDRRAAAREAPAAWHDGVSRSGHSRTVRRPMGIPIQHRAIVGERGRCGGTTARGAQAWARSALDTLFLAAPITFKNRLVQYVGRITRPYPGKATAIVHDYHDELTPVLASSLRKRAPGYTALGFPDPRAKLV